MVLSYIQEFFLKVFNIKNDILKYIIPIFLILLTLALYFLIKFLIFTIMSFYIFKKTKIDKESLKILLKPFQKRFFFLIIIFLIYFLFNPILKEGVFQRYFYLTFSILITLALSQIFMSIIELILRTKFVEKLDRSETKKWIKTVNIVFKILIWFLTILLILNILGIKISNLLTGLGISGVIIALATQSIFTDLFSYITILADKPFEVGDFISYDNLSGTVEFIGIKSTRIRILDGEQLIIPNTVLTGSKLRNFRNLGKRRVYVQLKLEISTPITKIEKLQSLINSLVANNKQMEMERCYITTIIDSMIQFDLYFYITTKDFQEFLKLKHEFMIEILKIIKKEKLKLVSNIHNIEVLGGDKKLEGDKTRRFDEKH